jgi:hypothetical protein
MGHYVCSGWHWEYEPERYPITIGNQHVPWSYRGTDGPIPGGMDEISKEEYEEIVRSSGVVLFEDGPVDYNPKSIEEGFYEDYRFINLYKKEKTKTVDGIEKDYKLIESKQFSSFMDAVRVLHLFESPAEWEEMDFLGKVVKNETQWLEPIYKLRIVNRKTPFQIYI